MVFHSGGFCQCCPFNECAEEEILMLKEVKVEQDRIVEELKQELKQELEKKEARIMELTDIIAKSTQNVNVNIFAVITDQNMFPLALEKFDKTFHGLPEALQVATAGVVMKSLPTELPPETDTVYLVTAGDAEGDAEDEALDLESELLPEPEPEPLPPELVFFS